MLERQPYEGKATIRLWQVAACHWVDLVPRVVSWLLLLLPWGVFAQSQEWRTYQAGQEPEEQWQLNNHHAQWKIAERDERYPQAMEATRRMLTLATGLSQRMAQKEKLSVHDKQDLLNIEKLARRLGKFYQVKLDRMIERGSGTDPSSALAQLVRTTEQLEQRMEELTQHLISVEVVEQAARVIWLSKCLRQSG